MSVSAHIHRPLQEQRATAYITASQGGDLVPDDEVDQIGASALADVLGVLAGTIRDTPFAPNLMRCGVDALAALSDRLSETTLAAAVSALEPSLQRPEGQYGWTDDGHFLLLARLASRTDIAQSTREEAARHLAMAALKMPHAKGNPNELIALRDEHLN